jgi:hypothetical protein
MSGPKPIGIDLASLGARQSEMDTPFRHPECPGARVYITHSDLQAMVQGGDEFVADGTYVPRDGTRGHARFRCGRPVEAEVGCAGHVVYFGLCKVCHDEEEKNRADLRRLANRTAMPAGKREAAE